MHREYPIVVLSHLRWGSVHQRPHHLLSRLAARHRVLFVEEPDYDDRLSEPRWERSEPERQVTVYRPRTGSTAPGFSPEQLVELSRLMPELVADLGGARPVVWLSTPLAVPLIAALSPAAGGYDWIEEPALLRGAPPELAARESELLARADVVFTAGPSVDRAKRDRHPNVHCFPSSVDADHFGRARPRHPASVRSTEPADQEPLPHPRLGYYGVLDDRLDYGLLAAVADARPEWHLVMVGPLARIDPAVLPRRANIHYLGQRTYRELPAYLGGWEVCLLPYAIDDASRFASPAKVLEYMATERPIVSSPIGDVAESYGDIVRVAAGDEAFVAACADALGESEEARNHRVARVREVLARTSWDLTVAGMERVVDDAVARGEGVGASAGGDRAGARTDAAGAPADR
jgi:glycosyltransferase involved in cell wall biosynthesis